MRKGILEMCILSVISKRDAYASDIIAEMKDAKLLVVEGTLYPLLTRLKNDGHLSYRWEESKSGPPRKYYNITENGTKLLTDLFDSWDELSNSIQQIRKNQKSKTE